MPGPLERLISNLEKEPLIGRKLLWLVVLAGCGGSKVSQEEFLSALPKREQVQIAFPAGSVQSESLVTGSDATIGQTADFYVVTRVTSEHLNGMVGSLLDTLGKITQRPPTLVEENRAVWGPFTPVLSPANYRLVIAFPRLCPCVSSMSPKFRSIHGHSRGFT